MLEMIKQDEVKKGLIVLPGTSNKQPRWGKVLSVGAGVPDLMGTINKPDVEEGDLAYIMAHGQHEIHLNALGENENLYGASSLDVMAVMKDMEKLEIQPLGSYIEIEKIEIPETNEFGIVRPNAFPSNLGRVIKVGKGWKAADGTPIPFQVKEGDLVAYNPLRTMIVDFSTLGTDKQKTLIMHGDILGVIDESKDNEDLSA